MLRTEKVVKMVKTVGVLLDDTIKISGERDERGGIYMTTMVDDNRNPIHINPLLHTHHSSSSCKDGA